MPVLTDTTLLVGDTEVTSAFVDAEQVVGGSGGGSTILDNALAYWRASDYSGSGTIADGRGGSGVLTPDGTFHTTYFDLADGDSMALSDSPAMTFEGGFTFVQVAAWSFHLYPGWGGGAYPIFDSTGQYVTPGIIMAVYAEGANSSEPTLGEVSFESWSNDSFEGYTNPRMRNTYSQFAETDGTNPIAYTFAAVVTGPDVQFYVGADNIGTQNASDGLNNFASIVPPSYPGGAAVLQGSNSGIVTPSTKWWGTAFFDYLLTDAEVLEVKAALTGS